MTSDTDWNPGAYDRFRGLRLRPALDLLAQVPTLPPGDIVDLGCGSGAVGTALVQRFAGRELIGVDSSPGMLEKADTTEDYTALIRADAAEYAPDTPPALIFSNALLNWLPDHARLLPRLAGMLASGGTLAIQMPDQQDAPSHRLLGSTARALSPGHGDPAPRHILPLTAYHRILAPLGQVSLWHSDYLQALAPASQGHPVRHFTQSTAMRPHLDALPPPLRPAFVAAYDMALNTAYPVEPDGSVLFPFRRLFAVLVKDG